MELQNVFNDAISGTHSRKKREITNILALVMWDTNWVVFVGAQLYCEVASVGISLKGIASFSAENAGKLPSH